MKKVGIKANRFKYNGIFLFTLFALIIFILFQPIVCLKLQKCFPEYVVGEFTIDSLLNYSVTILGYITTFVLSLITLYQTKRSAELQELYEIDRMRQAVFPDLYINIVNDRCDDLLLEIRNYSGNNANNLVISYDDFCSNEIRILEGNAKLHYNLTERYPSNILITYGDVLGSCIRREFIKTDNGYILLKTEYDL